MTKLKPNKCIDQDGNTCVHHRKGFYVEFNAHPRTLYVVYCPYCGERGPRNFETWNLTYDEKET